MADLENVIIRISVGQGTSLGRVKTRQKTWKTFKAMFDAPKVLVDTACTFAQYQALDVDGKGKKKLAAGNWMPALFADGKRKGANQLCRTMVAFDLDYVSHEQLENIQLGLVPISEYAWFMHTTRSHCPEKPRVRMVIPIDREVSIEEANALTRILATLLADDPEEGIEIPDIVSMKANQVMYLASRSRDQEYWTDENDAELLCVDDFLASYPHWEDHALLPYKESETNRGNIDPSKRMEDPREKQGYIGAFCRTYDVEDAISEFIPDVYSPGDSTTETRYTYNLGTGSNGAVVYDEGLFIYSNHGTDPIEGAANAWDMVRLHKFGHLDKDAPANTLLGNLPSSKAMMDMAKADRTVAAELHAHMADEFDDEFDDDEDDDGDDPETINDRYDPETIAPKKKDTGPSVDDLLGSDDDEDEDESDDIADGFDDDDDDDQPEEKPKKKKVDMSWTADFRKKANDDLEPVLNNLALICENDLRLKDSIGYNEFTMDPVCLKQIKAKKIKLPSPALNIREKKTGRKWTDADDASIKLLASGNAGRNGYECDFSSQAVQEAVLIAGRANTIHPVKDYIEECHRRWLKAGSPTGRIDRLAQEYLRSPDTVFHRESSRMFLIAAVARIYEPGCKFDHMVIIQGDTGGGKSTFFRVLFNGFFSEFRVDIDKIDRAVEAMRGNWCMEMAEMAKAKKADANTLKDFLSAQVDTIRLAYAKRETDFPRQSVMGATSNDDDFLSDPTSVRRYWVWRTDTHETDKIENKRLEKERHLYWGEAYQAYLDARAAQPYGELNLGLQTTPAIIEQRQIAEGSRRQTATESIAEVIQEWLDRPVSWDEASLEIPNEIDSEFDDENDGSARFIRNMVTPKMAFEALRNEAVLAPYRNADVRTYGKALKLVPGWTDLAKVRRHGQPQQVWFHRGEDGPLWIEAPDQPEDDEIDNLLA